MSFAIDPPLIPACQVGSAVIPLASERRTGCRAGGLRATADGKALEEA